MISRRRMVFQLTALLDLLLVVLFAQYMETQQASARAVRAESMRRAREAGLRVQAEQSRQESEKQRQLAVAAKSTLAEELEKLKDQNRQLQASLSDARQRLGEEQTGRVEDQKRSAEQLARIGEIFHQRLNIDPKTLNAYLEGASSADREKLLQEVQKLHGARTATVVQYLRATVEFKKVSSLWEIHIFDDNSIRIRFDGKDFGSRFYVGSAADFASRMIEAAKENGEPRSLVVVLLTWSNADRKTRDAVSAGLQEAASALRTAWGSPKRIEVSKLGYTPEAP